VLAHLAGLTSVMRLGTAVSVLPLHHPIRLAESTATVDIVSNGRLDLGIGKGYQTGEFVGLGVSLEQKSERYREALDVLLRGWTTDEPFSFEGEFWSFERANPQPKPLQRPHPPLWVATDSDSGMTECAENDYGLLLPQGRSPDAVADMLDRYRAALAKAGREYDPRKVVVARALYCAPTDAEAWDDVAEPYLQFVNLAVSLAAPGAAPRDTGSPFELDGSLREAALFGSPETIGAKLTELAGLGVERVIGFVHIGGLRHEQVMDSLDLFAREVLPTARGGAAAPQALR
jgi:alkanesulfonate monooxygenase SsuD/methylene tetrahydromethanopterin reductase-like flavin-dependent oxidoreductase (luciferase family)